MTIGTCVDMHAVSADKKTGEIRVVWVKPYIKGPDGKPIRVTEKVYALKR